MFLNYMMLADLLIFRPLNCKRTGRVEQSNLGSLRELNSVENCAFCGGKREDAFTVEKQKASYHILYLGVNVR